MLSTADGLLLAEVYAAGEAPIVAADGRTLARAIRVAGKIEPVFVEDIAAMPAAIIAAARGRRRGHHHGRRFHGRRAGESGQWLKRCAAQLKENEPMAGHVSWRAGGAVARAYFPADLADLAAFLRCLRLDEPLMCVGLGSNLLVRDGGFDGTMVFTHGVLNVLRQEADGTLYVEAGVASPKVARFAAN